MFFTPLQDGVTDVTVSKEDNTGKLSLGSIYTS